MSTLGKATKKEKKKPLLVKTSLNTPYDLKWKPLEKGNARFILKTVTDKLVSLDLRKQRVKVFRKWRSKRKGKKVSADEARRESQNQGCADSMDTAEPTQESQEQSCSHLTRTAESTHGSDERGWSNKHVRNELAIGINEVTKGLEKNELSLVLVCESVKPAHMTSHLISLSQTRSVPACQVPGLSASLAGSLGLTSVLALGFKRKSGAFADTIAALAPKVPPLGVPWVPTADPGAERIHGFADEEADREKKRKLEDSLEISKNPVTSLQPLKVKKIIPNPSKIRKPKIKKAKHK